MRFGWLALAAVVLFAAACSRESELKALPVEGVLRSGESDCAALQTLQITFSPSISGAAAEVYAVKARKVDSDYVATLAEKLGISGEPMEEAYRFVVTDHNAQLTVEKGTGNITFDSGDRSTSSDENRLADDEAIKKAEQFLQNLDLPLPGRLARVERDDDKFTDLVWSPKEFLAVEPYTFLGVSITFGNDGEITEMAYYWQDLEPIGEYPLASPAAAVQSLRDCEAIFTSIGPRRLAHSTISFPFTISAMTWNHGERRRRAERG